MARDAPAVNQRNQHGFLWPLLVNVECCILQLASTFFGSEMRLPVNRSVLWLWAIHAVQVHHFMYRMKVFKCFSESNNSEIIEHTTHKKRLCKTKVWVLQVFIFQICGHCVDLRKHIELRLWPVGLPFGEMFLALVVPFLRWSDM